MTKPIVPAGLLYPSTTTVDGASRVHHWSHSMRLTPETPTARIPGGFDLAINGIAMLDPGAWGQEGQLVISVGDEKEINIEAVVDLMLIRLAARRMAHFRLEFPVVIARDDHATVSWSRGPDAPLCIIFCLSGVASLAVK